MRLSKAKVFFLEDEPLVSMDMEMYLDDFGVLDLTSASSVPKAAALFDAQTFDLAILDVNVNGQSSLPIAERIHGAGTSILFTTGYQLEPDVLTRLSAELVVKPYSGGVLTRALGRLGFEVDSSSRFATA